MKLSTILFSAILTALPCAAQPVESSSLQTRSTNNPWTNCVHPQSVECDITDSPPSWEDVTSMRENWAKQAVSQAEDHDVDPKEADPGTWGGSNMIREADAYNRCSAYKDGSQHGSYINICQKHKDGNFGNVKGLPAVCISHYMDVIMQECKDKGPKGTVSGKLWADRYGAGLQIR